jgi:hypothetical protein
LRARTTVVPALLLTILGACTDAASPIGAQEDLERLCQALQTTTTDEVRELFFGPTHQALHDLADDLQNADLRPVAGDVLEAKQSVEAALAADPVPEDLPERMEFLVEATSRGLAVLDRPTLSCTD